MKQARILALLLPFFAYAAPQAVGAVPDKLVMPYAAIGLLMAAAVLGSIKHEQWRFIVLLLVSTCVSTALADLLFRPVLGPMLYYRPEDRWLSRWPSMPELSRFAPNKHFDGEVAGDLSALSGQPNHRELRRIEFVTDERGYRNRPGSAQEPVDVLIAGDSVGIGMGVSQKEAWEALESSPYGFSVYNLSTGGSPWDSYMNVAVEAPRLKLKPGATLLWIMTEWNDLGGRYADWTEPRFEPLFNRWAVAWTTFRNRSPIRILLNRLYYRLMLKQGPPNDLIAADFPNGRKMLFLESFWTAQALTKREVQGHVNYPRLKELYARMHQLASDNGFRVAVLVAPSKESVYSWVFRGGPAWSADPTPSGFSEAVAELSAAEGFQFLDLRQDLIQASKSVFEQSGHALWFYDDTHWNAAGYRAAIEAVYKRLLRPV